VTAPEILGSAQQLIARGWCQGVDARDSEGAGVDPWSRGARSWSLLGAVVAADGVGRNAVGRIPVADVGRGIVALGEAANTHSLQIWNDEPGRTGAEVIALLDEALAILRDDERGSAFSAAGI
jgi:hypothetical protein